MGAVQRKGNARCVSAPWDTFLLGFVECRPGTQILPFPAGLRLQALHIQTCCAVK